MRSIRLLSFGTELEGLAKLFGFGGGAEELGPKIEGLVIDMLGMIMARINFYRLFSFGVKIWGNFIFGVGGCK